MDITLGFGIGSSTPKSWKAFFLSNLLPTIACTSSKIYSCSLPGENLQAKHKNSYCTPVQRIRQARKQFNACMPIPRKMPSTSNRRCIGIMAGVSPPSLPHKFLSTIQYRLESNRAQHGPNLRSSFITAIWKVITDTHVLLWDAMNWTTLGLWVILYQLKLCILFMSQ